MTKKGGADGGRRRQQGGVPRSSPKMTKESGENQNMVQVA